MNAIATRLRESRAAKHESQLRDVLTTLHMTFGIQRFTVAGAADVLKGYSWARVRELLFEAEQSSFGGRRVIRFPQSDDIRKDLFRVIRPAPVLMLVKEIAR